MAWCPICKNEYRPGIKVCSDCGAELVEKLDENLRTMLIAGEEEMLQYVNDYLKVGGVKSGEISFSEENNLYALSVLTKEFPRANEIAKSYVMEYNSRMEKKVMEDAMANATPQEREKMERLAAEAKQMGFRNASLYESSAKKMEENKASAWSLLVIGGIGLVLIVLCFVGVIPFMNAFEGSYLFMGVMGSLSLLFLIMGFVSFKNAKGYEKEVESENGLKESLIEWCKENLKGEDIDRFIKMRDPSLEGEALFFPRNELIKSRINHQFINLDQDFLDRFVDDVVYEMVFAEDK